MRRYEKRHSDGADPNTRRGISRRSILRGATAAAGMAAASAAGGFPTLWAQEIKDIKLRQIGVAVSNMKPFEEMASEALGFAIQQTAVGMTDVVQRGITQPQSFDVMNLAYVQMKYLWPTGNFHAIDGGRIAHWDKVVGTYKKEGRIWPDASYGQGQNPSTVQYTSGPDDTSFAKPGSSKWLTSAPTMFNADTLGYRPDLTGRKIDSFAEILNDEFNGKTAFTRFPSTSIKDAALGIEALGLASYVDKGNMTTAELDATFKILVDLKKKGHFRTFWSSFNESVQLMASGEVVIQSMWSPAVAAVRSQGVPCVYADLKEGYHSWSQGLMLAKHLSGKPLDAAHDYVNWYLSGPAGAFFARQGYYLATPDNTKDYLSKEEWDFWYEGEPSAVEIKDPFGRVLEKPGTIRDGGSFRNRMGRVAIWSSVMDENEYLVNKWNEFLAA